MQEAERVGWVSLGSKKSWRGERQVTGTGDVSVLQGICVEVPIISGRVFFSAAATTPTTTAAMMFCLDAETDDLNSTHDEEGIVSDADVDCE